MDKTIPELLANQIKKYSSKLLLQKKDGWSWKPVTWLDFDSEIKNIAAFLGGLGFAPGDTALVVSSNRTESFCAETAIHLIGGITAPMDSQEGAEDIAQAARDLKTRLVFVGDEPALNKVLSIAGDTPVEKVVIFSDYNIGENEKVIPYRGLIKFGMMKRKQLGDELTKLTKNVQADFPAVVFSSGKGVRKEITQSSLIESVHSAAEKLSFIEPEDQLFSYMPSVSPFEKLVNHIGIYKGSRLVIAETRQDFLNDVLEVMPTVLFETSSGLDEVCKNIHGSKLKSALGSRVKHIITDAPASEDTKSLLQKAGISVVKISELNHLS